MRKLGVGAALFVGLTYASAAIAERAGERGLRVTRIERPAGVGEFYFSLEGVRCSTVRDFFVVSDTLPGAPQIFSLVLAAHLSGRTVKVDFDRNSSGLQCNVTHVELGE